MLVTLGPDPRRCKNSGPKNELHKYRYAADKATQGRPIRKRGLPRLRREERRGQLRLSLTNTYPEWPDKRPIRRNGASASAGEVALLLLNRRTKSLPISSH